MRSNAILLAALALGATTPFAHGHDPSGTLKNYCEDPSDWETHDYAPPASGLLIFLGQDGNLAGDCNGDGLPADYDLHIEFAFGGAWLTVTTVPDCNSETGHHPQFGPISVHDDVNGGTQAFWVASDFINLIPPTDPAAPNCGDFDADDGSACVGSCSVTFPAGLDGTYQVYVGDLFSVPMTDQMEELLSNIRFAAGGGGGSKGHVGNGPPGSCCTANCFLGTCSTCCTNPTCYCDLMNKPTCTCS